ncbi:protein of unknown function [Ralstonia solanacearum CMR15]|nr:protein of unknown function [Ralstonia solanacearum CMR15]
MALVHGCTLRKLSQLGIGKQSHRLPATFLEHDKSLKRKGLRKTNYGPGTHRGQHSHHQQRWCANA